MKEHAEFCEAEAGHAHDCTTATRLARLIAFAEGVLEITDCGHPADAVEEEGHADVCLHHAALDALEVPNG